MRSPARCRHSRNFLHFSGDCFAALQIDLSVRGLLGAFAALAAYAIPISSRTMSFPADSTGGNLRRPPLPKTKQIIALPIPECNQEKQNSNSGRFALYRLPMGRVGQVRRVRHVRQWILGIGSISSYSTNDKAILYASHKPIQSLKMSH